ncbi:metalloprotease TldD [Myxococcota bacterium]|nr:metalloprotease TldD [Myxococcota bacterium]
MADPLVTKNIFQERFGIDETVLEKILGTTLERDIDYGDLYFEHTSQDSVSLEEGIVKSGDRQISQGVGIRAQSGERQGYAYSDEITVSSMTLAATAARAICEKAAKSKSISVSPIRSVPTPLYSGEQLSNDISIKQKTSLLGEIDAYARRLDPRIVEVMASVVTQNRNMMIFASDEGPKSDIQPLVRLNVQVIAEAQDGSRREVGYQGFGGRYGFDRLTEPDEWKTATDEAVRLALLNLEAVACPAGTMDIVLGPGWPGVLLHEAIGHGLEGDFNRKGTSAFSDKLGQRIASKGVTVVDDGTLFERRGSINIDDEGTPTQRTVLIEDGILTGYMQDKQNSRLTGFSPTGNGRRESYAHLPMPRMTNTFMLAGDEEPEDLIRSVQKGLYAVSFGGGQVDITNGKFVFNATEAYEIENGVIRSPVRGATLIGNGPDVLTRIQGIGNDLELDKGVGTCGKDGQSVPVGVGMPTVRLNAITVGGTEG